MSDAGAGDSPNQGLSNVIRTWVVHRRRDEAVGQVLEAMLIGALVMGAVGFAVAFQAPPPPSANVGSQNLAQETWDAVDALNNMHYPDAGFGNSTLSKVIADAAGNHSAPLANSLRSFMPPGSQFQVYLNNGYDRIPLYTNVTPDGQTVGIAYPFEPNWKHHYGRTDLRLYNTNASNIAMGTNLIPLFNSNHVQDEGQYVRGRVSGEQTWAPGLLEDENITALESATTNTTPSMSLDFDEDSYTTLLQGNASVSYPSAAVYLRCERSPTDEPCYAIDLTDSPQSGYGPRARMQADGTVVNQTEGGPGIVASRLEIVIDNDGPGDIPSGTLLEVFFPAGMDVREKIEDPDNDFIDEQNLRDELDAERVKATLDTAVSPGDTAELHVWVSRNDTRFAYKTINARLSEGAASSSQLLTVVADKIDGTYTGGDSRVTHVSAPRPAGSGEAPTGRWAVVMPVPYGETKISDASLAITEGDGRFTDAKFPTDFNPTWPSPSVREGTVWVNATDDKSTITWDPSSDRTFPGYSFIELQFNVTTDGTFSEASPQFPVAGPKANFEGYQAPPHFIQIEPGIWWQEHPPDDQDGTTGVPGYGATGSGPTASDPIAGYNATNRIVHRNSEIEGTTPYQLVDIGNATRGTEQGALEGALKDAMHSAKLSPAPQRVTPGGTVNISIDSRDFAMFLSEWIGVNSLNMTTEIYAPWGVRNLTPVQTYDHKVSAALVNAPNAIMAAYLNGDNAQDLLVVSADGNVYGIDGRNGDTITGRTFSVPETQEATSNAEPNMITRALNPGVGQMYGVGTGSGLSRWYSLDQNLDERWAAEKPEGQVETLALNTSQDLTGDGVPEYIAATTVAGTVNNPYGRSRLVLYDGVDQGGDGLGDVLSGWTNASTFNTNGVRVNGTPSSVGFANLGPKANGGVYASTGKQVGTKAIYNTSGTFNDFLEGDIDGIKDTAVNFSLGVKDSGLVGLYSDGDLAWNYTGGRFAEVLTSDKMDLGTGASGNDWSGLLASGEDGWIYGFNGSQPQSPVDGWTGLGLTSWDDVAMANELEGYKVASDGIMVGTRDGWTTEFGNAVSSSYLTNLNAVDTPDGPYNSGHGNVSWWVGDGGLFIRSEDRLETRENLTGTAQLSGILSTGGDSVLQDPLSTTQDLDLSQVNLHDIIALSPDEAWAVGEGASGTAIDDYGYIIHAKNEGQTLTAYRLECKDAGSLLTGCGIKSIAYDGNRLWIAGDYGTVLVQDATGQANNVDLVNSGGVNGNGILPIELSSSQEVKIRNVTVNWEPFTKFGWMRGTTLNDANGNPDLWNKTDGGDYIETPKSTNYDNTKGAARDATLFVKKYTNGVSGAADTDRVIDGSATLMVGPFKKTLLPSASGYYSQSWYENIDDELLNPDNLPITFSVNVTYEDGSADTYQIKLEDDGTVTTNEIEGINWVTPDTFGYTGPGACFGMPNASCVTYNSINVTRDTNGDLAAGLVGEIKGTSPLQSPILRLPAGESTFQRVWDPRVNQTMNDIAINLDDPDRWVAVGPGPTVARSFDHGGNWSKLPTLALYGEGTGMPMRAVDYTHPTSASLMGGSGEALHWYTGGYTEFGRVETVDLWSEPSGETLERVDFNHTDLLISQHRSGNAEAKIEIWDPGLDSGNGGWATVFDPGTYWRGEHPWNGQNVTIPKGESQQINGEEVNVTGNTYTVKNGTGWPANYNFTEPTGDIRLRFTLNTAPGFTAQSPQVRGNLNLSGYTDKTASSDVSVRLDLNTTSSFSTGTLANVDHSAQDGYLRLTPADNPWIWRLGNYGAGDWSSVEASDRGARPNDIELAPDGHTLYVGTGGIHQWAAVESTPLGEDNSLYALNVTHGRPVAGWDPVHFDNPIREISVGQDTIYVMTADEIAGSYDNIQVHRVYRSNGTIAKTIGVVNQLGDIEFTHFDAFLNDTRSDEDLAMAVLGQDGKDGKVRAFKAPGLGEEWNQNPSVKGQFAVTYDVPRRAMYGAYIVVTEMEWTITGTYGNELVQTGRLHNSFSVTPPTKRIPLSPTYNLEVIAWMEDWG